MASNSQISSPRTNGTSSENGGGYLQNMVFKGCSSIREYEIMGKLGEGTFGSVHPQTERAAKVDLELQ